MALAFDGWTATNIFTGSGTLNFFHKGEDPNNGAPTGTHGTGTLSGKARGVLVLIGQQQSATDHVTSVEISKNAGGPFFPLARIRFAQDTAGELGASYAYFLGAGILAGAFNVRVITSAVDRFAVCVLSFTATENMAVTASGLQQGDAANPSITLDSGSDTTMRCAVLFSGQDALASVVASAGTEMVYQTVTGAAPATMHFSRQSTPSSGSSAIGYTSTIEDVAMVAVAVRVNINPAVADPDPSSLATETAYFQAQKDSISRFRALVAKARLTECQNAYAQSIRQWLQRTDEFDNAAWTKSGGATVDVDVFVAPDGNPIASGDRLLFAATSDNILQATSGNTVTSKTFTGSVWLQSSSPGTIELTLQNAGATESALLVCNVTSTWQRFSIQKQFSGIPVDAVQLKIGRGSGGLAEVAAWRANVTQNPVNDGRLLLFPTVRRQGESVDTVSVMAGRCQAADAGVGKRCSYSGPTCQDPANINTGNDYEATAALQGYREMLFSSSDAVLPVGGENFLPMIQQAQFAAQEIYPDKSVTINADVKLTLADDTPTDNWNLVQAQNGFLTNTNTPSGTFLRRFRTIYRNFANPRNTMTLYESFPGAGATLSDLAIRGTYLMHSMKLNLNMMELELVDPLKLMQTLAPAKVSDSNLTRQNLSAASQTLKVDNVSQLTPFPDPGSPYQYPVVIQVDYDGTPEYCNVLSVDATTNILTISRGRWGTTGVTHPYGSKWREVLMLGTEHSTSTSPPLGLNPFDCILQLLHRGYGNLSRVAVATLEAERDLYLPGGVSNDLNFGIVFKRAGGVVGTANAAIVDPTDIDELLHSIRQSAQIDLWINKDQVITGRKIGPLRPTTTLVELADGSDIIANSVTVDENEITRVSRVVVAFALKTDKEGTAIGDYSDYVIVINADAERPGFDGEVRSLVILSPWILANDTTTATTLALQVMARYHNPIRKVKLSVELRNDYLQVGTTVALTTDELQDSQGAGVSARQHFILRREPSADSNHVVLLMQDEAILRRFAWISPDAVVQYDSATPAQKRYGFIADSFGLVGTISRDQPYYIWPV